ncbi:MAG: heparan-alpha-glucosaminide N-acetyltransferase domain-containing protein [Ignavibacteriales bacterium]|nr:MAG: DUF1624 domain-containing protein [Ignavibacteriaceae bacterium]MBW7873660.1 DUF1624 domain-containing protein [Ignavibacteria bacterium]MCZ2143890.1 heparan-alpha-glucosaminide N-acetyltransferase domain-containing protein [Ignavibacteriales bacterium]MBV6445839.1 hypothetical protein [Ignavibacteriaceae bacterium]MBZ0197520.1 heparan-alpha-glucosaminide N-acetyltransferase domain-containing protein [Ignavibacteriaceae bacterium]
MSESSLKNRVIFLDLLMAPAVFMLIFSIGIENTLAQEYRNGGTPLLQLWVYVNSLIIPFFIFSSGTLFIYLYKTKEKPFRENLMVKRGIKRGIILLLFGYILQLPWGRKIAGGGQIHPGDWVSFSAVDLLQLLGVCMLLMVLLLYFTEKLKLKDWFTFTVAGVLLLASGVVFEHSGIAAHLPAWLKAWFTQAEGSKYPLFHFGLYFLIGNCTGCFIYNHPEAFESVKNARLLVVIGIVLVALSFGGEWLMTQLGGYDRVGEKIVIRIFKKSGFIMLGIIVIIQASISIKENPKVVIVLARNTLLVYLAAIILIERTPLRRLFVQEYGPWNSFLISTGAAIVMLLLLLAYNKSDLKNFSMMRGH